MAINTGISSVLQNLPPSPPSPGVHKQEVDPIAMKKAFGDKKLDQILNELSDPHYQGRSRRVEGFGNDKLGKNAFFKLMLAQLKQQDPTNPLKSHEMAAQLAQFSSVEQLAQINQALSAMGSSQNHSLEGLNLIGRIVSGDSSKLHRLANDSKHNIKFQLSQRADQAKVQIKDASGKVVWSSQVQNLKQGPHQISWDGFKANGQKAAEGSYRVGIQAYNASGPVKVSTQFKGPVEAVELSEKGTRLQVQGQSVDLKDIRKIALNPTASASKEKEAGDILKSHGKRNGPNINNIKG